MSSRRKASSKKLGVGVCSENKTWPVVFGATTRHSTSVFRQLQTGRKKGGRVMQAKIRHVAVMCQDAPRVARFYELLFALTSKAQTSDELHAKMFGAPVLGSKRVVRPYERTIIVSDGNIGFAFLRRAPGYPGGIDHFGIEVDDLDTVFARMKDHYPKVGVVKRPANRPFAAYSSHDPEGHYLTWRSRFTKHQRSLERRPAGAGPIYQARHHSCHRPRGYGSILCRRF